MGESTARDERWERGEQHGQDHIDAVRPRVAVVYCSTRSCEVAAKGPGMPVVCFDRVRYCNGRLEKNEQYVKTETRDRE